MGVSEQVEDGRPGLARCPVFAASFRGRARPVGNGAFETPAVPAIPIRRAKLGKQTSQRKGSKLTSKALYRFPHRSYQEYLAACYLNRMDFPRLLRREAEADPDLWREVLLLAAGKVAENPFTIWGLLEALVPKAPGDDVEAEDPRFVKALFAGLDDRSSIIESVRDWV